MIVESADGIRMSAPREGNMNNRLSCPVDTRRTLKIIEYILSGYLKMEYVGNV